MTSTSFRMRIRLHCPNAGILVSVHLWSDTHILVTFQAFTVLVVVLNERNIQLYTLDNPELCPTCEEFRLIYLKAGNAPL